MNGRIKDDIDGAIQQIMDKHCDDDTRWPHGYCPDTLARRMANAAEVVFDASFESSVFTEKECRDNS